MHTHVQSPHTPRLPDSPAACRERLAALQDEIASIRLQIATTDIRRQTEKRALDPIGFHRAKTALRLKQQELARLKVHLATLEPGNPGAHRDRFKDALIEVLRAECDDQHWARLLGRARALLATWGTPHG